MKMEEINKMKEATRLKMKCKYHGEQFARVTLSSYVMCEKCLEEWNKARHNT